MQVMIVSTRYESTPKAAVWKIHARIDSYRYQNACCQTLQWNL